MSHDEWIQRRKQNIRETAVQISKEIHLKNMEGINKNLDDEQEPDTTFPEAVLNDADMIQKYIETGQKVYKD